MSLPSGAMTFYLIPDRIAITKEQITQSPGKDVRKKEFLFATGENVN
jgi:hypothetical protein